MSFDVLVYEKLDYHRFEYAATTLYTFKLNCKLYHDFKNVVALARIMLVQMAQNMQ